MALSYFVILVESKSVSNLIQHKFLFHVLAFETGVLFPARLSTKGSVEPPCTRNSSSDCHI